jgi:uncharacterized protein YunC (DUF1805 family)
VVGGSHGAIYAAYMSAKYGCRAAIHHDAGIGKDEAGIGGLAYAENLGMAMAAVATASARIGEGEDMYRRGVISRANALAEKCGVRAGMSCKDAVALLKTAPWPHTKPPTMGETRHIVEGFACVDSSSLLVPEDRDGIVATGSHCALNSGLAVEPFRPRLVFFNDAGPGADQGGIRGFEILDRARIAGVAVAAASAHIGDGRSTLQDGTISHVSAEARRLGAVVGGSALALARAMAEKA